MIKKPKYYSLKAIDSKNAHYNMIIGERSNGKTYACLKRALENYFKDGKQFVYLRRWEEDFKRGRGASLFASLCANGEIEALSGGEFDRVIYYAGTFRLGFFDHKLQKAVTSEHVIGFGLSITSMQHDKSTSYPNVSMIIFDEFLTRSGYLPDEFVSFMNVISTIVRLRDDVKIYMLGNTVNKSCPYFKEMGIRHISKLKKSEIMVCEYGDSSLRVAVEYADSPMKNKPSSVYFAFDNPRLEMITSGVWELALYPHAPTKYKPKDVAFSYFIEFDEALLQCDVVAFGSNMFTFIHEKTTPIQEPERDLIYSTEFSPLKNRRRKITKPETKLEQRLLWFYNHDRVFYQDNEIGEVVRNYFKWCELKE